LQRRKVEQTSIEWRLRRVRQRRHIQVAGEWTDRRITAMTALTNAELKALRQLGVNAAIPDAIIAERLVTLGLARRTSSASLVLITKAGHNYLRCHTEDL